MSDKTLAGCGDPNCCTPRIIEGVDMVSTEDKAPSGKPSDPSSILGTSTTQYYPIAIIVRDDDINVVATTMLEVERILEARYGKQYGITIYDPGDEIPTIAFFNNHDSEGVQE